MNQVIYNLMDKVNNTRIIDEEYLESLYDYYKQYMRYHVLHIEEAEFKKIITIIYDVLRLKISEEEFRNVVIKNYLKLLIADGLDNYTVDSKWFIDHIWYLNIGVTDIDTEKYKDCVLFIQNRLLKEFNIDEKVTDKIKRKLFVGFMTR